MKRIPWGVIGALADLAIALFLMVVAVIAAAHGEWSKGTFCLALLILTDDRTRDRLRKQRPIVSNIHIDGAAVDHMVERKRNASGGGLA